jgi:hypothetical protein
MPWRSNMAGSVLQEIRDEKAVGGRSDTPESFCQLYRCSARYDSLLL